MRMSQTPEKRKEDDSHSRLTQNLQTSRNSMKHPIKSSKSVPVKESFSSTSKSNINKSRISSKSILTTKTQTELMKKSDINAVKSSKSSSGRIQSSYSEKRGQSTIFIPQSLTTKLNVKLSDKSISSVSKNGKEVKTYSSSSETTELKPRSRQRRLSRTLSPSEVKMLHSANNRSDPLQKMDQKKKEKIEVLQIDNEYDYEDDFEVKYCCSLCTIYNLGLI